MSAKKQIIFPKYNKLLEQINEDIKQVYKRY